MEELVGTCHQCQKPVYCENGFLNGEHMQGKLLCSTCATEFDEKRD